MQVNPEDHHDRSFLFRQFRVEGAPSFLYPGICIQTASFDSMSARMPARSRQGCVISMPNPDFFILLLIGVATVAMALIAVLQKNLIRAVIAFAVSSAGLATLFFLLSSAYAAVLELTVGAGLVAVLFLVALILAGGEEEMVRT